MDKSLLKKPLILLSAFSAILLAGCGGGAGEAEESARDITPEVEEYYRTFKRVPIELNAQLAKGQITQEEFNARMEDVPLFFQFRTLEDLPPDLDWENGMDLPEFGDPDALKGGTLYGALQDFPRTLRPVGPDSNGSFRPYILDDVAMQAGSSPEIGATPLLAR